MRYLCAKIASAPGLTPLAHLWSIYFTTIAPSGAAKNEARAQGKRRKPHEQQQQRRIFHFIFNDLAKCGPNATTQWTLFVDEFCTLLHLTTLGCRTLAHIRARQRAESSGHCRGPHCRRVDGCMQVRLAAGSRLLRLSWPLPGENWNSFGGDVVSGVAGAGNFGRSCSRSNLNNVRPERVSRAAANSGRATY